MRLIRQLLNLFRRNRRDSDIEREFSFHVAEKADELEASGMPREQAQQEARRTFGNRTIHKENTREVDLHVWLESIVQDVKYGFRIAGKSPIFAAVVILSLSIGIGMNATLFSLIDAMFRPMPVQRPSELVYFKWAARSNWLTLGISGNTNTDPVSNETVSTAFSYTTFQRFREQSQTLSDVLALVPIDEAYANIDGHLSVVAEGQLVSGNYFSVLGVTSATGRTFTDDDERDGNTVVVLAYRFWELILGKDPGIVGKTMTVNGVPLTVIGVSAPGFVGVEGFAGPKDFFVPMALYVRMYGRALTDQPWRWWVPMMGRMKSGMTRQQVHAELEQVFLTSSRDAWNQAPPAPDRTPKKEVPRLLVLDGRWGLEENVPHPWSTLGPMLGISLALLAIVGLNVATLLNARMTARQSEIGVRLALGGGRFRVLRQLLTEITMISLFGALLSIPVAYWARGLLVTAFTAIDYDLRIDSRTLLFSAVTAILAGILIGLMPAFRVTAYGIQSSIKEKSQNQAGSTTRLGNVLLVAQIAISVVLLVSAGMFLQTIHNLRSVDVGFDKNKILLFRVNPGSLKYDKARIASFYSRAVAQIAAIPGVQRVTFSSAPLVSNQGEAYRLYNRESKIPPLQGRVRVLRVRANFFQVLGVPVLSGRSFDQSDTANTPQVAVINETLARDISGTVNPVGQHFGFSADKNNDIEVVGVTRDIGLRPAQEVMPPAIYLLDSQDVPGAVTFTIRTAIEPTLLVSQIRKAVRGVDSNVPTVGFKTETEQIDSTFTLALVLATSATFFSAVALALMCIGLFGLMSYSVQRRTNEIGVRIALGAERIDVVRMVMLQSAAVVSIGTLTGVVASVWASALLARLPYLFRVPPHDPKSLIVALVSTFIVAAIATYLPARRASRVDPTVALRRE